MRDEDEQRSESPSEGVLLDQLREVRERLLSFGRELGGEPEEVTDLPFTEEAGLSRMPEPLYVRHDTEMLNQVTAWLLQDQHIGLVSPYGTGKTAFREIVRRDLGKHDEYVLAALDNPREITPRKLYAALLDAAAEAGYGIDPDEYEQVRDGVPWITEEAKAAVQEVVTEIRADGKTLLLLVDEIEVLPEGLLSTLQVAGDMGVRLFLMGTPEGKRRVAELRGTLGSRLRYYEGIDPFEPSDIAEYVGRSLAYFRGEEYDGSFPDLFTREAIRDIHEVTEGNPREVRIECRELFIRAAFVWYRTGQDIDRIQITPELRKRRFGMEY
ncbi:AAA family ATPase [Halapricum hydrolyticum]|uniref:AAA family ATPase n=1 Tax=Halapricum hydrolyticum TaxID=2979991 RepID=A0AAE3LGS3_9EURY|nr:AAA family ATPase [Halapricum hydrolyticum]MCU4719656.1 AAA family ATPase [Halapricum hydrolyticum]MCU4725954.1 AAA family ATPase [Halapricum hydrolyticum]